MMKRLLALPTWVALLLLAAVIIVIALLFSSINPWNPLNYVGQPRATVDVSRPAILKEVQALSRLETASYTMDKVIEAGVDGNVFQNLIYGDRILLIAHGQVVAGVDLSQITENDIHVNQQTLTITVPAPQIFSTTLDSDQTKVYDRQLGLLSKGDKDLETQARAAAEQTLQRAACEGGILSEAKTQAQDRLAKMYSLVGFQQVIVNIPDGRCE